jgi:hypothetical protein
MYQVNVSIVGIAPLLQHRFPMPSLEVQSKGGKKNTGAVDYSMEWKDSLYITSDGMIYQPSSHIERALVKAAANFKVTGKRGRSYKDLVTASIVIDPEKIPHNIKAPDSLSEDADEVLYQDRRPVIVMRSRVVRARPAFKPGWKLDFTITVIDDELPAEILQDCLTLAGKTNGLGDYRPKFGRFSVARFEKI